MIEDSLGKARIAGIKEVVMLTDEEIKAIANKAERVVITGNYNGKDIGMKIGSYSMTTSIKMGMSVEAQERAIRRLQTDLVIMNRKEEWQRNRAQQESK
jgi:hypothetical protein